MYARSIDFTLRGPWWERSAGQNATLKTSADGIKGAKMLARQYRGHFQAGAAERAQ